jgi:hypothetical protein
LRRRPARPPRMPSTTTAAGGVEGEGGAVAAATDALGMRVRAPPVLTGKINLEQCFRTLRNELRIFESQIRSDIYSLRPIPPPCCRTGSRTGVSGGESEPLRDTQVLCNVRTGAHPRRRCSDWLGWTCCALWRRRAWRDLCWQWADTPSAIVVQADPSSSKTSQIAASES